MLQQSDAFQKKLLIALDIFIILLSYIFTYYLRDWITTTYSFDLFPVKNVLSAHISLGRVMGFLWIILPIWFTSWYFQGVYNDFRVKKIFDFIWAIIKVNTYSLLLFAACSYILKLGNLSRSFLLLYILNFSILMTFEKFLLVRYFSYMRKKGTSFKNILLIGSGERAESFINLIEKNKDWGFHILGLMDYEKDRVGNTIAGIKVIGYLDNHFEDFLNNNIIDEVIFIVPRTQLIRLEEYILRCEIEGIKTSLAADFFNLRFAKAHSVDFHGIPFLSFETTPSDEWKLFIKRTFDVISSFLGIIFLFPLFGIIAILIKLTSKGPVLFIQERTGLNGRPFKFLKFRTMCENAEELKADLNQYNEMSGPVFKLTNDPRITKLGKFLRISSLDELPQLFNVFLGQMSIVGPRPPLPQEVRKYKVWQKRRLSMRPGITCLWQVGGRNKITEFNQWMKLDLEYIDNWSLYLDFLILLKTIPVVLLGIGAK